MSSRKRQCPWLGSPGLPESRKRQLLGTGVKQQEIPGLPGLSGQGVDSRRMGEYPACREVGSRSARERKTLGSPGLPGSRRRLRRLKQDEAGQDCSCQGADLRGAEGVHQQEREGTTVSSQIRRVETMKKAYVATLFAALLTGSTTSYAQYDPTWSNMLQQNQQDINNLQACQHDQNACANFQRRTPQMQEQNRMLKDQNQYQGAVNQSDRMQNGVGNTMDETRRDDRMNTLLMFNRQMDGRRRLKLPGLMVTTRLIILII